MMKYQKYEKYKDSEIEWLGDVPKHWELKQLRFCILKINNGTTTQQLEFNDSLKPITRIETISKGTIDWDKTGWIEPTAADRNYLMKKGDILFSHINSLSFIGNCAALESNRDLYHGMNLLRLQPRKDINYKWLLYFLKSKLTRNTFSAFAKPAINQASLPTSIIKSFKIPVPSYIEQQAIANYLDRETIHIDTLIDKKQKLIELLKEKRTALITQTVTKGLNPDVKMKDSGIEWLGEVPEHWEVQKLKFISSINDETLAETTQEDYEIKYVDIGSVDPNYGITKKQEMIFAEAPSRARRKVKDGDVIVSTVRTYLRAIAPIIKPEQNLIVSTGFAVIRPRKVTSRFLEYALRGVYFVEKIVSLSVGVSYPAINSSTLSNIYIALPPTNEEQLMISNYLKENIDEIDRITNKVSEAINKHREYRTTIISAAVTGKIKVTQD